MKTRLLTWLVAALCMGLLSACSKTVKWEEEVPLNTGEVIWVERSVTYKLGGVKHQVQHRFNELRSCVD